MCLCQYMPHVCSYLQRSEEDAKSAGTEVMTGHCDMDAGNQIWVLRKIHAVKYLCRAQEELFKSPIVLAPQKRKSNQTNK